MKLIMNITVLGLAFLFSSVSAASASTNYQHIAALQGEWKLAPAEQQEGGATKNGPAAKLLGTDKTAISFKVIGKGSTVQENLLPDTGKEMATMYHCNDFKSCTEIQAKHYCAKQNQPEFKLDAENTNEKIITMECDMNSSLCNSAEGHVHTIVHQISDDKSQLTSTYKIFKDGKYKKSSIYHFVKKDS